MNMAEEMKRITIPIHQQRIQEDIERDKKELPWILDKIKASAKNGCFYLHDQILSDFQVKYFKGLGFRVLEGGRGIYTICWD